MKVLYCGKMQTFKRMYYIALQVRNSLEVGKTYNRD